MADFQRGSSAAAAINGLTKAAAQAGATDPSLGPNNAAPPAAGSPGVTPAWASLLEPHGRSALPPLPAPTQSQPKVGSPGGNGTPIPAQAAASLLGSLTGKVAAGTSPARPPAAVPPRQSPA
ncbi:MAG TPA: hypothetical protein VFN61_15360, partial [Acidimicrobiales bacterium]|nr:hypothetical protein [Acidimicrobiales bacterium]